MPIYTYSKVILLIIPSPKDLRLLNSSPFLERLVLLSRTQRSPLEGNLAAPEGSTTCPSPRAKMDTKGRSEQFPYPRYSLLKFLSYTL